VDPAGAFSGLPDGLRKELLESFEKILRNFRERRWEPAELNGGKLCEVVYCIVRGYADGEMPAKATKPKNMVEACKDLEKADQAKVPRAVRIQIPRMLVALYEVRNNRGVGHVGGDVDPNHMDARVVVEMSKWVMADLVRVFHSLTTDEAARVVDTLVERTVPTVWEVGGRRRVLPRGLKKGEETLLLLYSLYVPVKATTLSEWVEYSSPAAYRRDILRPLHGKQRFIEFDEKKDEVVISPTGIAKVERDLPLTG
jgi:hypothetical protein